MADGSFTAFGSQQILPHRVVAASISAALVFRSYEYGTRSRYSYEYQGVERVAEYEYRIRMTGRGLERYCTGVHGKLEVYEAGLILCL